MRTARYWSRAGVTIDGDENPEGGVFALGWSDISDQDAHRVALERARRSAAVLKADQDLTAWEYPYPDRPIREPVIDEVYTGDHLIAAITRNVYGSLILNTTDVMFIDIDAPVGVTGWLGSLLTGGNKSGDLAQKTAETLHAIVDRDARSAFRLYQTAAGLRVLATGRAYNPVADETVELMKRLRADRQYVQLCKTQACFRARLTPKPWRCGVPRPPVKFPFVDEAQQQRFDAWLQDYERQAGGYAVCKLIAEVGNATPLEHVHPVLTWHDELACSGDLPLA